MPAPVTPPSWHRQAYSLDAMRELARRALPRAVFDFADGGAESEVSLRRNESAFAGFDLLPRPLNGAGVRDLSIELFGQNLSMPVMIGPTGLSGLFWPEGELASARAAHAAGTAFCLSHGSTCTMEDLAASGTVQRWMQVFLYRDRGFTRAFVERAAASGFGALVLTIDNQLIGNRERDVRNGFTIPPRFTLTDKLAMLSRWRWLLRMGPRLPNITFANYAGSGDSSDIATLAARLPGMLDPSLSWRDVEWMRSLWKGPFLLKGVLHPDEAVEAINRGVDGIIVSNHGGRQLDGSSASLDALPEITDAVDGRIPILLDGGVRRGADVIKAIALGASCCLVARPQLFGLAVAGEAGVARVLDILKRELDRTMGLLGVATIAEIGPDYIRRR